MHRLPGWSGGGPSCETHKHTYLPVTVERLIAEAVEMTVIDTVAGRREALI